MVRLAQEADPDGDYRVGDVVDLPLADASVDLAVSFMVLQDVPDHEGAIAEAARVLTNTGAFCFAIVHPVASAGRFDAQDQLTLASYCAAFEEEVPLRDRAVTHYHRPLCSYADALENARFVVEALREVPSKRRAPGRYPMFLHVRARKR